MIKEFRLKNGDTIIIRHVEENDIDGVWNNFMYTLIQLISHQGFQFDKSMLFILTYIMDFLWKILVPGALGVT